MSARPTPRRPAPPLQVPLLGGGRFDLAQQAPGRFSLIVFYRGYHCPVCRAHLSELNRLCDEFEQRGVRVIAISSDSLERATRAKDEWRLQRLSIGYGLAIESGRDWGLYVSSSRGKSSTDVEEPPIFTEPGLYLIEPDGTVYAGSVVTMPFARPRFDELLTALGFIERHHCPARGEA